MFHDVKENPSRWNTTPRRFREIVEIISIHPNRDKITITVDDAGKGNFQFILPILREFDFQTYIFVPTKFISNENSKSSYMTESQIRTLSEEGHIIGSHSHTHPINISLLDQNEILEEWKKSKNILENITGKEILSCSIPGGFFTRKQIDILGQLGYDEIFNSVPTFKMKNIGTMNVNGRFSIERNTSNGQLNSILNMDYINQKKLELRQFVSQKFHTVKHSFMKS